MGARLSWQDGKWVLEHTLSLRETQRGWETAAGKTAGGHAEWATGGTFPMGQQVYSASQQPLVPNAGVGAVGQGPPYVVTRYQEIMVTSSQWTCTMALCWAKSKGDAWTQAAPHPGLAL